jgi:hypothetical protein
MRTKFRSGRTAAVVTGLILGITSPVLAAPPAGGGGGGGGGTNTGDVFADLVVALRDIDGVPILTSYTVDGETGPVTEHCVQPCRRSCSPA